MAWCGCGQEKGASKQTGLTLLSTCTVPPMLKVRSGYESGEVRARKVRSEGGAAAASSAKEGSGQEEKRGTGPTSTRHP